MFASFALLALVGISSASAIPTLGLSEGLLERATNDGIHLAIGATCGASTGNAINTNVGLPALSTFKTLVSFGDSYSSAGKKDGTTQAAAVLTGTSPKAGGRTTNGLVWAEGITGDFGMTFKDYAVGGAVTDKTLWPSKANNSDMIEQVTLFLGQNNNLNTSTTLYTVFFGINDISASNTDGAANAPNAAAVLLNQISRLQAAPTNARNFLVLDVYGRGSVKAAGETFKEAVFAGLRSKKQADSNFKYTYVDLKYLWTGVLTSTPGYQAFGYTSSGGCTVDSSTTVGQCSDPAHTFYYIPGHPSKQTHRIMADYAKLVVANCASA